MNTLKIINTVITVVFLVCYSYQFLYIPIAWIKRKKKTSRPAANNNFAVLICARNESSVIGDLIDSIKAQTYDKGSVTVFVMADNCTDNTYDIAKQKGAAAYRRKNDKLIGKGYALEELRRHINEDYPDGFDGYFVFDADNILSPDYIEKMNETFSEGADIVTGYRNSKNFGSNWISAGYALWFIRECKYLNSARARLGTSCHVTGTGFLFSRKIADEIVEWPYHLLTEDIEFSVDQVIKGRKVAYCEDAVLYDEQPVKFSQSWRQRLRWTRGYLQVIRKHGKDLIKGIFHGNFSCYDLSMLIMPAYILSSLSVVSNIALSIWGTIIGDDIMIAVYSMGELFVNMYALMFVLGAVTTITEWKKIKTTALKKVLYTFTLPIFMFTYIPIAIAALFVNCGWKPIEHSISAKDSEIAMAKDRTAA